MKAKQKQSLLGPVPEGKVVVFRKRQPIFIDKEILAWRKKNKKRAKRQKQHEAKMQRYRDVLDESMDKLGARVINPFATDDTENQ